jgi:hypothetical protein
MHGYIIKSMDIALESNTRMEEMHGRARGISAISLRYKMQLSQRVESAGPYINILLHPPLLTPQT